MEGCAIVLVIILGISVAAAISQAKARERARAAYQGALARLKRDPANPDLREETLSLGRQYSNLTRNRRGVTIFDEVALSNDISAACAGAFRQEKTLARPLSTSDVEARLTRLADLKTKGLIDDTEFAARRQEILREI